MLESFQYHEIYVSITSQNKRSFGFINRIRLVFSICYATGPFISFEFVIPVSREMQPKKITHMNTHP